MSFYCCNKIPLIASAVEKEPAFTVMQTFTVNATKIYKTEKDTCYHYKSQTTYWLKTFTHITPDSFIH